MRCQALQTWFELEVPSTSGGAFRLEEDEDDKTELESRREDVSNEVNVSANNKELLVRAASLCFYNTS